MLSRVRRAFFKSAGAPLLSVATVSIIRELALAIQLSAKFSIETRLISRLREKCAHHTSREE